MDATDLTTFLAVAESRSFSRAADFLHLSQPAVTEALGWQPLFKIQDPFLYFSVWAFLVAMFLIVVVSFLTRPEPKEKLDGLLFRRKST